MKENAYSFLGSTDKGAVITFLCTSTTHKKQANKYAGNIANLDAKRILSSSSPLPLSSNSDSIRPMEKSSLSDDLGGGTFDIYVLVIFGGVFEVMSQTETLSKEKSRLI